MPTLSREEVAARIATLPVHLQRSAAEAALQIYGAPESRAQAMPFRDFVRAAWPLVEPRSPYVHGWHIDAIADHLEAITRGEIRNLAVTLPPRHGKSTLVAVMWPAWVWTFAPEWQWIFASYSQRLSERDSVKCRLLVQSPWYQLQWGHALQLTKDQNQKWYYSTTQGGHRIATSPDSTALGMGADCIVADDALMREQAMSDTQRGRVNQWWDETMSTRVRDPATARRVIIMQRLHQDDLVGHVLSQGGYEHLNLPMEWEGDPAVTSLGWSDPRQGPNEILWADRFTRKDADEWKRRLGTYGTASQLQQRPVPLGGGIFKRFWWRFWFEGPEPPALQAQDEGGKIVPHATRRLPESFDESFLSWDMAFKGTMKSDYVVGQVWGRRGPDIFLLDQVRRRMDFPDTVKAVRALMDRWPHARRVVIEEKANGAAVISELRRTIAGVVPFDPKSGKEDRAASVSAFVESGNVYLPHPSTVGWAGPLLDELTMFPNGAHDDQVDALTQALLQVRRRAPLVVW